MFLKLLCSSVLILHVVSGLQLSCENQSLINDKHNLSMALNSSYCQISSNQTTTSYSCSQSFQFSHLVCDNWPELKQCVKNSDRYIMRTNYHVQLFLTISLEDILDENITQHFFVVKLENIKIQVQPLGRNKILDIPRYISLHNFEKYALNLIRRNQVLYFDALFEYHGPNLRIKKGDTDVLSNPCVRSLRVSELPTWTQMIVAISNSSLSSDLKVQSISMSVVKRNATDFLQDWISYLNVPTLRSVNASNTKFKLYGTIRPEQGQFTHLYLSNCNLGRISESDFKYLQNLTALDLSKNKIDNWEFTENFPTLQKLNLSGQKIGKDFSSLYELSNMTSLKSLNLSHIYLEGMDFQFLLSKMKRLETLDLRHCNLKYIQENSFSTVNSLKYLNLDHNEISYIPHLTFLHLSNKVSISFKYNNLQYVQELMVNNISELDLSNNRIEDIDTIIGWGTIDTLILKSNNIENWKSKTIFYSKKHRINHVNLQYNKIQFINSEMADSLTHLTSLDIGGNPFYCQNSSFLWNFLNSVNSTNILVLNFGSTDFTSIKCDSPVSISDKYNQTRITGRGASSQKVPKYKKGVTTPYPSSPFPPQNLTLRDKATPSPEPQAGSTPEYNVTSLVVGDSNLVVLTVGLPVLLIALLIILIMWLLYSYRFDIMYIRHLLNDRRKNKEKEKEGCRYDVFVSYSSKDRDWVMDVLLPGLENPEDRYCLCLHERDFRLGSYIVDNIVNCIDQSRRVLFVLSRSFVDSEWCRWELRMAQHRIFEECRDSLILLELERLDRSSLPLHLRVLMHSRTYLEWPSNQGDLRSFWARLKEGLGTPLDISRISVQGSEEEQEEEHVC